MYRQPQFSSSHKSLLPFLSQSKNLVHRLVCSCSHEQEQLSTPSLTSIVVSIIIWVDISHLLSFLGRRHATFYFGLGMIRVHPYIVSYRSFLDRRESGPREVAWTHSHSASLGSLPLQAHNQPARPVARSGKPAGSLVGGVMTSRKVLPCGEISEKMHFHFILE